MALVGGIILSALFIWFPFGSWELAFTPSPRAVQLLGYDYPELYTRAVDNLIYACDEQSCNQRATIPQFNDPLDQYCGNPNPQTPFYPGGAINSVALRACGPEGYVDIHLVLLQDGTVWKWKSSQGGGDWAIILFWSAAIGAGAGAIAGIIILVIRFLWARRGTPEAKASGYSQHKPPEGG